ncbi:MAG TPA: T9SS type A sorting domain-containing protein [Ignavibacteriaceae bacterium]|nr:T9SS type A sorting domain-containing protein [Ignavibacteriaceae bacterium]
MKKLFTLLLLVLFPILVNGQPLLNVDFSGGFPPAGWSIDLQAGNWAAVASTNAGGTAPELRLNWSPQFNNTTHFTSPVVNLTGISTVTFQFKHNLDHYGGPYTIGVATRSHSGSWNTVWSIVNPSASTQETVTVPITNSDVGAADFQICFFFSGNSYNVNFWYIDDVKLFVPLAHDVMVKNIIINPEYTAGTPFTPKAELTNFGLNSETFNATCVVKLNDVPVYTQDCAAITLAAGNNQIVSFPDFTPSSANDLYEVTVTTNLAGDMDSTNNSKTKGFDTYTTERQMVILEIGTGTWCQYCPGASMGAHDLLTNGKKVGVIKNHNGDSFTNSYSNARNSYYGITGYPTAFFDGVVSVVGGSYSVSMYSTYLPIYDARKVKNSAFSIQLFGQNNGLDYTLTVRVTKLAKIPASYTDLVLHLALTESEIPFNWQGQTMVNNAQRLMAPNELGTALDFSSSNTVDINLNFTMNAAWVAANCEIVSFIQNLNGKEILQGNKVALNELGPLPVELTSFSAKATAGKVNLNWTTATEINNSGFEVERSFDGSTFFTVGFVRGNGTTTEPKAYSFSDELDVNGTETIYYRLKQVDYNGAFEYSDVVSVVFDLPTDFALGQNYPNPFNPTSKIKYSVPQSGLVSIVVYDLTGQEVATIINEVKEPGNYEINFNAGGLSSGVYFYRMTADNFTQVKKMSILK